MRIKFVVTIKRSYPGPDMDPFFCYTDQLKNYTNLKHCLIDIYRYR